MNICFVFCYFIELIYSSSICLAESLGFSIYGIMSSVNNDSISSFSIWIPFISSLCLMTVNRTYSTMLTKSGESRLPGLVPDLKGNAFSFCQLYIMLAVSLSYTAFIMLRYVPSVTTLLRVFIINACWILSNAFSASIDKIV